MKVVRTTETQKIIPVYPLENVDASITSQTNNVVKVQPNNFLIDNKLKTMSNSNSSSLIDLNKSNYSPKNNLINPNNHVINNEINTFQDISFMRTESLKVNTASTIKFKSNPEKADSETNIDITSTKNVLTDKLRASRHHHSSTTPSHGGTRNILLDNAQNVTPFVLPTKPRESINAETTNTESSSENVLR